ncbi:MAG TPA: hypothetical protein VMB35_04385 [Methanomicrobiales archaeon]|nr:hypothetical protein [Methanomicrobiales archaeon]
MAAKGNPAGRAGGLAAIREVKARHEDRLLSLPGVVSVGIGTAAGGDMEIVVGLDRHRPGTESEVPVELEGFRVRVEVIGRQRAL